MTENNYYKDTVYIGPPIKFAYIGKFLNANNLLIKIDDRVFEYNVTENLNKFYGNERNWNYKLYTANQLFNSINYLGKDLYIEFDDFNPNFPNLITFSASKLNSPYSFINPPSNMPLSKNKDYWEDVQKCISKYIN